MATPEPVRPGDLITAAFVNGMMERISSLEGRVDRLEREGGPVDDEAVAITALDPPGTPTEPLHPGDELRIEGRNFGFSVGGHRVFFDSTLVTAFKAGSGDELLILDVPSGLVVGSGGRTVTLSVSNGETYDTRTITVRPVQQTLSGDVDVLWRDDVSPNPNPNPIPAPTSTSPQTVTFNYRLRSRANLPATFTIQPTVSVTAWQASLQVLNASGTPIGDRQIRLNPGQEVNFAVRATLTPTSATSFSVNVVATAGAVVGSLSRDFEIGVETEEGDPAIDLTLTDVTVFDTTSGSPNPGGGSFDPATNTISVRAGNIIFLEYDATFEVAEVYTVTARAESGTSGWTVELTLPPPESGSTDTGEFDETGAAVPVGEAIQFSVQPESGASGTGEVVFRIQREGETRSQTRNYQLRLQT